MSVAIRIVGDFSGWQDIRSVSGFLTIVALIGFAITVAVASIRKRPRALPGTGNLNGVEASR
jgi:hypothetical protein